jgi:two-component system sensor histidine kinase KdpD
VARALTPREPSASEEWGPAALVSPAIWLAVLAVVTTAMMAVRPNLDRAHVALAYLLVVLGAGARGGRRVGIALSIVSFLCFNFFFVPPYHSFGVAAPLDWLVLVAFLITGVVAAQLLARAQSEAFAARERTADVDRLAALGADARRTPSRRSPT